MRKLIAGLFVTLDGVVESPERWPAQHFDVGVHEVLARVARLFEDLSFGTALRLVDSHTFDTGVVSLTFEPRMLAAAA